MSPEELTLKEFCGMGKLLLADTQFNLFSSQTSVIPELHLTSSVIYGYFVDPGSVFNVYICSQTSCHLYLKSVVFNWKSVQSACQGKRF